MALATPDAVVLELMTMGQQSAAHLGDLLRLASTSSPHPKQLAAEILRCCSHVIATLKADGAAAGTKKRKSVDHDSAVEAACSPPRKRFDSTAVRSSPRSSPYLTWHSWRDSVANNKLNSPSSNLSRALGGATSSTMEDEFIWRKYGQKEIKGRNHPRLYYRCAYRHQGCMATRRVQRTQQEPTAYEIAYYGEHTCGGEATTCQQDAAALQPTVVDFGSNNASSRGTVPVASEQLWSRDDGEISQGGWSSSSASPSSDVQFEAQTTTHEGHDTAQVEVPSAATPSDPVMEFFDDGCFDWESLINHVPFDFGALLPSHCNASGEQEH